MRDITQDLRERLLGAIENKKHIVEQYNAAMKESDTEIDALKALVAIEEKRGLGSSEITVSVIPIADFIVDIVKDPLTKDEIREALERAGYLDGQEAAGRTVHATIVNIERAGRIVLGKDGRYRRPPQANPFDIFPVDSGVKATALALIGLGDANQLIRK